MKRSVHHQIVLLIAVVLATASRGSVAQDETGASSAYDRNERAHIHNPDMSCCAPCVPTAADQDPDVFRRPCFVRALVRSRDTVRSFVNGLSGGPRDGSIKLAADRIPSADLDAFRSLLNAVLQPTYLPARWEDVEFHGLTNYPIKTKTELRNGVPTSVGYEPDLSGEVKLREGDGIQTAWAVGGVQILPFARHGANPPQSVLLRLRLHGDERLVVKPRPADFVRAGVLADNFGDFFDKAAFHALLSKVFRVPFETPDELLLDGYAREYEGARVFHGKIRSRDWEVARKQRDPAQSPPHWWDEMRLLVTDSDPQYFCVSVVLRDMDLGR